MLKASPNPLEPKPLEPWSLCLTSASATAAATLVQTGFHTPNWHSVGLIFMGTSIALFGVWLIQRIWPQALVPNRAVILFFVAFITLVLSLCAWTARHNPLLELLFVPLFAIFGLVLFIFLRFNLPKFS